MVDKERVLDTKGPSRIECTIGTSYCDGNDTLKIEPKDWVVNSSSGAVRVEINGFCLDVFLKKKDLGVFNSICFLKDE